MARSTAELAFTPPKNSNAEAGTPYWFLSRMTNELLTRAPILRRRGRYTEGDHDLPTGDRRYMQALRDFREQATTNYYGMITRAPVERMEITGFRFGPVGEADSDAQSIWSYNDMGLQSLQIHVRAAKYGLAYALVSPPDEDDDTGLPIITAEDPRTCIVYRDPVRPTKSLAGLRLWADDIAGRYLAVLYMPDQIYFYEGPETFDTRGMSIEDIHDRLFGPVTGGGFVLSETYANELGEVPLVEYVWKPESGALPEGEAGDDIRKVQDRINQSIFNRISISHFQAYKQRWISGVDMPKGKKAKRQAPFEPGMDMLWVTGNEKTKFGQFDSADITQILTGVRDDVADIASLSSTPAHYLMGKMANISGETLTQAEGAFVSKIQQRQKSMGWSHERVMKLCFAYMKQAEKAKDVTAETLWSDPQKQIDGELALAGQQWAALGIPLELIMKRQGWSPDDQEYAVEQKKLADEQALQLQQAQADQAHANAMEMAKVKPPGTGANPTSTTSKSAQTTKKTGAASAAGSTSTKTKPIKSPKPPTIKGKAPGGGK